MVSAIILSYNRCPEVLITIDKLKAYRKVLPFELEIIVVDNASVDDTSVQVKKHHPDIVLVTKPHNNGIAGWNEGFKIARNPYFLVLDDDSHIHSGLTEAVQHMEQNPNIGILAFETVDEKLQMDIFLKDDDAWKDGDAVAGFIGCGALIRQELYKKIGGYAEWIHLYTHEFEYSLRCLAAGYQVRFFGDGIVIHRVSKLNRVPKNMRIYATRNEMEIINKYFGTAKTKYLIRTLLNNLKFIKREGLKSGYYILKGAIEFLKIKNTIPVTPVSQEIQNFYATHFWSTKPVFLSITNRIFKKR